jgi:hypothetical protein
MICDHEISLQPIIGKKSYIFVDLYEQWPTFSYQTMDEQTTLLSAKEGEEEDCCSNSN